MDKTTDNEKVPFTGGRLRSASKGCAGTQNNIRICMSGSKKENRYAWNIKNIYTTYYFA